MDTIRKSTEPAWRAMMRSPEVALDWWQVTPLAQSGPLRRAMGGSFSYSTFPMDDPARPEGEYCPINDGFSVRFPLYNTPRVISYEAYLWQFKHAKCRKFKMPKGEMFSPPAKYDGRELTTFKPAKVRWRFVFTSDGRTYDKPKKGEKKGRRRCKVRVKGRGCPTAFLIATHTKEIHKIRPPVLGGAWRPQGVAQSLLGTRKYKAPNYHWAASKPTTGKGRVIGTIQKGTRDRGKSSVAKWGVSDEDFWKKLEK